MQIINDYSPSDRAGNMKNFYKLAEVINIGHKKKTWTTIGKFVY